MVALPMDADFRISMVWAVSVNNNVELQWLVSPNENRHSEFDGYIIQFFVFVFMFCNEFLYVNSLIQGPQRDAIITLFPIQGKLFRFFFFCFVAFLFSNYLCHWKWIMNMFILLSGITNCCKCWDAFRSTWLYYDFIYINMAWQLFAFLCHRNARQGSFVYISLLLLFFCFFFLLVYSLQTHRKSAKR